MVGYGWRWILATLVTCVGCGGKYSARVAGQVTLDGQPVSTGSVSFEPTGPGMMATGKIDTDGSYALSSNAHAGLTPGEYRVMLDVREPAKFPPGGGLPTPGKLLIPARYARTDTSGLVFDVAPGGNRIDIQLKSRDGS